MYKITEQIFESNMNAAAKGYSGHPASLRVTQSTQISKNHQNSTQNPGQCLRHQPGVSTILSVCSESLQEVLQSWVL